MTTRRFDATPEDEPALLERTSIGGALGDWAPYPSGLKSSQADLSVLFVMPDLGKSGVVGGGASLLEQQEHVPSGNAPPGLLTAGRRDAARPHTVSLSDGTKITFASADALTGLS